ncbi:MAG TPA: AarF/UbiB family protein [Saprospiraceae bacterium]|nr:AarF/UbiB family protein [Saprospiraceae bacterium]
MTSSNKIYKPAYRIRKAYWVTFVVLLSYSRLWLMKKIFGKNFYQKRILALHLKNAERVKNAILDLQGLFIKIGQMLSILSNFLPEAFQKPLESLQDKIPPRPFEEVKQSLEAELGKTVVELFTDFDSEPVASASIGQVHKATLKTGEKVAVKIQHLQIETIASVDLEIVRRLTGLISWFYKIQGMDFMYSQIKKMIEEELDFSLEAQYMDAIRKNLESEAYLAIPQVYLSFSTKKILTTAWHDGKKITRQNELSAWNINKTEVAERLLKVYSIMVFRDGLYHADPHPGNILIKQDGTVVLLDFGAVGSLGPGIKAGIPRLIEATIKNNTEEMIAACRQMGFIAEGRDAEKMAEKMISAIRHFLQYEVKFEGLNFKEIEVDPFDNSLFHLIRDIGISGISGTVQLPKDYVLLNRAATLLLGICTELDPKLNPLDVIRPYVKEFAMAEKDWLAYVTGFLRKTLSNALGLPDEISKVLRQAQKGELEFRAPEIKESARLIYILGQQFLWAFLMVASLVLHFHFFEQQAGFVSKLGYWLSGFFGLLFIISWIRGNRLQKKG